MTRTFESQSDTAAAWALREEHNLASESSEFAFKAIATQVE